MEHILDTDSNHSPLRHRRTSAKHSVRVQELHIEDGRAEELAYISVDGVPQNDYTNLTLHPLNFDNHIEISRAVDFLSMLEIEEPDWEVFVPTPDSEEDRVFVTEFIILNGKMIGLMTIDTTSTMSDFSSRAAVMNCLLDLQSIHIGIEAVQAFISHHLSHLAKRQSWTDLQMGAISSFSSLHELQQF